MEDTAEDGTGAGLGAPSKSSTFRFVLLAVGSGATDAGTDAGTDTAADVVVAGIAADGAVRVAVGAAKLVLGTNGRGGGGAGATAGVLVTVAAPGCVPSTVPLLMGKSPK